MLQHPDFPNTDLSRLQTAGVGGAPCAEAILRGWIDRGVALVQGWGMTETSPGGTMLHRMHYARLARRKVSAAYRGWGSDDGTELPWGEVGELLIRGPNITLVWNNPEATKKSFVDGWLRTGDAARFDDEGFIYIVDRWKDMYISGGENVYPRRWKTFYISCRKSRKRQLLGCRTSAWVKPAKRWSC